MTDHPRRGSGWTKDQAGAAFAYAAAFFCVQGIALDWTKQAVPNHAYVIAYSIASVVAFGAAWIARKIMRRLP